MSTSKTSPPANDPDIMRAVAVLTERGITDTDFQQLLQETVPVTLRKGVAADGSITSEDTLGWKTSTPHLVITPEGKTHFLLTHAPSGYAITDHDANVSDLRHLAELLAPFDWSNPELFEARPDDWDSRLAAVTAWCEETIFAVDEDSTWTVRA